MEAHIKELESEYEEILDLEGKANLLGDKYFLMEVLELKIEISNLIIQAYEFKQELN